MTLATNYTLLQDATDDDMVIGWAQANEDERRARELKQRIEMELERRMTAQGATAILNPFFEVKLETPATLDPEKLRPLAELIPPDEWKRGFTEAHEERITTQVPARADLRVVKGWIKYGVAIAAGINAAKVYGQPRVKITPKGVKP